MSVQSFQPFIASDEQLLSFGACVRDANLLKLSQEEASGAGGGVGGGGPRVALVVDAEDCLDRLYGGYFSDWACGGQWAHMLGFLSNLVSALHRANVQLAFFFNGALEAERFQAWRARQLGLKGRTGRVLRHVVKRATPPPKAWWVPPCGLQTMLRMALKTLNCSVFNSAEDHRQDVMAFCWENGYHGVMADDAEYAMANPPRYFSARSLKMTFQFEVTTAEYMLDEVAKSLDLNPNRFCLLGALLGNHILTPGDLEGFHGQLAPELGLAKLRQKEADGGAGGFDRVIRAVVKYIRALPAVDDYERIGADVFGSGDDPRVGRLRASVEYYASCSREGHRNPAKAGGKNPKRRKGGGIKMASELTEAERVGRKKKVAKAKAGGDAQRKDSHADLVERIALDLDNLELSEAISVAARAIGGGGNRGEAVGPGGDGPSPAEEEEDDDDSDDDEEEEDPAGVGGRGDAAPAMSVLQALASGVEVEPSAEGKYPSKKADPPAAASRVRPVSIPDAHPDVYRTALERHRQAQMSPLVYQLLTRGEVKLPVLLEDHQAPSSVPPLHQLYQPLRQSVYAVLFNLHHHRYNRRQAEDAARANRRRADELRKQAKKCESEEEKSALSEKANALMKAAEGAKPADAFQVVVREWLPYNDYEFPDAVEAEELPWAVPTVQRLWFGSSLEDKQKRLRAFLSCLRSDNCPPLLVQTSVPQHMVLLACVLRYVMTCQGFVALSKPELDALLATAFSPELREPRALAEMKLEAVTKRGVEIATMLVQGLEMSLLANDACGAPIPAPMCLPWLFFDGKLFHSKLRRAETARNLMELCDGRMEIVYAVERMRAAILHGLVPQYSGPGPVASAPFVAAQAAAAAVYASAAMQQQRRGGGGGGQLVVGGSVVGQWGPNPGALGGMQQRPFGNAGGNSKKKKKAKKAGNQKFKGEKDGGTTKAVTVATGEEATALLQASIAAAAARGGSDDDDSCDGVGNGVAAARS